MVEVSAHPQVITGHILTILLLVVTGYISETMEAAWACHMDKEDSAWECTEEEVRQETVEMGKCQSHLFGNSRLQRRM
jgi:hypothetical protein